MVLIDGVKYACERCIRGHRVTTCNHTDKPLVKINPKGRPSTQCKHCKEGRKNNNLHSLCTCGKNRKSGPKKKKGDKQSKDTAATGDDISKACQCKDSKRCICKPKKVIKDNAPEVLIKNDTTGINSSGVLGNSDLINNDGKVEPAPAMPAGFIDNPTSNLNGNPMLFNESISDQNGTPFDINNSAMTQSWENLAGANNRNSNDSVNMNRMASQSFDFGPPLSPGFSSDWELGSVNGGNGSDISSLANIGLHHQDSVASSLNQLVSDSYSNNIFTTASRYNVAHDHNPPAVAQRSISLKKSPSANEIYNGGALNERRQQAPKVGEVNIPLEDYISPTLDVKANVPQGNNFVLSTNIGAERQISAHSSNNNLRNNSANSNDNNNNSVVNLNSKNIGNTPEIQSKNNDGGVVIDERNDGAVSSNPLVSDLPLPIDSVGHGLLDLFNTNESVRSLNSTVNNNKNTADSSAQDINSSKNFINNNRGSMSNASKKADSLLDYDFSMDTTGADDQIFSLFDLENMDPYGNFSNAGDNHGIIGSGEFGIINDSKNDLSDQTQNSKFNNVSKLSNKIGSHAAAINSSVMSQLPKSNLHYKKEGSSNRSSVISTGHHYGLSSQHSLSQTFLPNTNLHHHGHHHHHHYYNSHDPYPTRHTSNLHGTVNINNGHTHNHNKPLSTVESPSSRPQLMSNNSSDSISSFAPQSTGGTTTGSIHGGNNKSGHAYGNNPVLNIGGHNLIGGGHVGIGINNNHNNNLFNSTNMNNGILPSTVSGRSQLNPQNLQGTFGPGGINGLNFDEDVTSIKSINSFDPSYFDISEKS